MFAVNGRWIARGGRTVPRGATMDASANAYEMKLPSSPTFMSRNPDHLRVRSHSTPAAQPRTAKRRADAPT